MFQQYTKLNDINIRSDRQRQEFDPIALQELADSIEKNGLLHPIILRKGDPARDEPPDSLWLVAGERRIKAVTNIYGLQDSFNFNGSRVPEGCIPYTLLSQLDELAAEEAELEENFRRRDLTWQEHAAATQRLHNLRLKQKGQHHTVTELAKEIKGRGDGYYREEVRQDLILAKHLDNPAVAQAKTAKDAVKILKSEERRQVVLDKAAGIVAESLLTQHKLLKGDCLQVMQRLIVEGQLFDVLLTDPPYGMGAESFGDAAGRMNTINHKYDDSLSSWRDLMTQWSELSFKLCKPQAHAYVFCDIERYAELKSLMESAGWYVHRTPLIYHKTDGGRVPLPDIGPRRCWEMCLYAIKGKKPVTHIYPDVFSATADTNLGHGAQKPVACYHNLLLRSCHPGDTILDTFAGTGTIFPAAQKLKCIATGIELEETSYAIALNRLKELVE